MIRFVFLLFTTVLMSEVLQREGFGWLEQINGQQILHIEGTPYELGYQHGRLLKDQVAYNIHHFIDKLSSDQTPPVVQAFMQAMPEVVPCIPDSLIQEMQGIADGAEVPYEKILLLNLFPEMFHCSAITVHGKASENGTLYHARVLDYAIGGGLQNTAVAAIVKPDRGYSFLNVTYAGFIGSVTGMNDQQIALGEIGGKGYGSWKGLPMSFLLRLVLENTASLDEIISLLHTTPRTCEYHYIFSDGKTSRAIAVYATADQLHVIPEGAASQFFQAQPAPLKNPPQDCLILTRWDHHDTLLSSIEADYGKMNVPKIQEAIRQIAHPSNLHNAIFSPATLEAWISHAGPDGEPACNQPYHRICLETAVSTK
ncbi:MAG TPA: C45 family peptidase [Chlamydiales bacterium]|nr:C45 family peptidase [Chlamydiales bacterium]